MSGYKGVDLTNFDIKTFTGVVFIDVTASIKNFFFLIGEVALPSSGYSTRQMKPGMANHSGVPTEGLDHTLGLGELAGLTVTDEAGPLSDVSLNYSFKFVKKNHIAVSFTSVLLLFFLFVG